MSTASLHEFYPALKRRPSYSSKVDGRNYSYSYFREHFQHEIAEDCGCRCVYCDSHEVEVGGREQMQIDHFRPYTRRGFEDLEDDPKNFHHACVRCNSLKSDKWPSTDPEKSHDGVVGFIDPFGDDRRRYFNITADGELIPLLAPAQYLIRVLALNRQHLKLLRRRRFYCALLVKYEVENLPRWEAALRGEGITIEELAREFEEFRRLYKLCLGDRS